MSGFITTVTGEVASETIGRILPHEHIYIELGLTDERFDYPDMLDDDDVLAEELLAFKQLGGTCIVEVTLPGVGRQPERLRVMSERTGVAVVMGCGWYRSPYYPAEDRIERRTVADLTEQLISEIHDGADGTGIRPGVIGEIGVHTAWVAPIEERVNRAAARAQRATGLPMLTHSAFRDVGLAQLTIFEDEGADLTRVAIGHADSYPMIDFYRKVIGRGAMLVMDNIGNKPWGRYEERLVGLVRELVDGGHEDRIMLSQDICKVPQLKYHGGPGYTYVFEHFLPRLREAGLPETVINKFVDDNPRRWLSVESGVT